MTALIIGNGSVEDYASCDRLIKSADMIICADGGASHARKLGIMPDILIGDFDSVSGDDLAYFRRMDVHIEKYPVEKNMTDTELAVNLALDRGFKFIILLGCWGRRLDHSIANLFILKRIADRGANGLIVTEDNEITVISDKLKLDREDNVRITLLAFTGTAEGVTTQGLYYPLHDAVMDMGSSWGVSNEFVSDTAEISVKNGYLLVIKSRI